MAASSGKLLAAGMLVLGLAAAVLSISYRRGQTQRALALWGAEQAVTIATAPQVTALWFDPPLRPLASATPGDVVAQASPRRLDVSKTPGIATVRGALIEDTSFDWQSDSAAKPRDWTYALEFSDPTGSEVLLLLDPTTGLVRGAKDPQTARLTARAAEQLKVFFQKQFADPVATPAAE